MDGQGGKRPSQGQREAEEEEDDDDDEVAEVSGHSPHDLELPDALDDRQALEQLDEDSDQPLDDYHADEMEEEGRPASPPAEEENGGQEEEEEEEGEPEAAVQSPPPKRAKSARQKQGGEKRQGKETVRAESEDVVVSRNRGRARGDEESKRSAPRRALSRSSRDRVTRTASPQRRWVEPVVVNAAEGDGEEGVANGTRKSSRFKIAPLAFWRGEKLVYGRGSRRKSIGGTVGLALPELKEVIHVEPAQVEFKKSYGSRRRRPTAAAARVVKTESVSGSDDDSGSESEWQETMVVEAPVRKFENPQEFVKKVLAIPSTAYEPREVVGQGIFFQKTLSEEPHFAAGVLDIPTGAGKPMKPSKQNTMFFFIFTGYVEIRIADNLFKLRKGGQFTVPRGNFYEIRNVGQKDARLVFSQCTDTLANYVIAHPGALEHDIQED